MNALLQQALDALELATTPLNKDRHVVLRAIEALRAAIAQPESEPAAWMTTDGFHAMPAEERDAWLESGRMIEAATDYTIPLYLAAGAQPTYK